MSTLQFLIIWSEVWAFLIPLAVIVFFNPTGKAVRLLIAYVIMGFLLNFCAIFTLVYPHLVPPFLKYNNNIFYNVHSFIMVLFLGLYILKTRTYKHINLLRGLIAVYVAFVLTNFTFFGHPLFYSIRTFTTVHIVFRFF